MLIQAEKLKEFTDGKEILDDDEIENLQNKRKLIHSNRFEFCLLIIKCNDILSTNIHIFDSNTQLKEDLSKFLKDIPDISILRKFVEEYDNGNGYGDHYLLEETKEVIESNREKYLELINLFFKIFGETI
jgi:hypothetical protein